MILKGTYLNVIDNSGAKTVCCIKVLNGYRKRYGYIGDLIIVSVKKLRKKKKIIPKVKKGDVIKALIVKTKSPRNCPFFEFVNFDENSVILINKQNKLVGTRIFGAVPKILRTTRFLRITSLSSGLIK